MRTSPGIQLTGFGQVALCVLALLVVNSARSQATNAKPNASVVAEKNPIEVFQGPHAEHIAPLSYPITEDLARGEGWVKLGFMVDTKGKPFEITVLDSTGNKNFEKAAEDSLRRSTFVPGSLNGQPTESGSEFNYKFLEKEPALGAQENFVRAYNSLLNAVAKEDKAAADAAIRKLKVTNLYEDAFFGLAHYDYARIWGTDAEELAGLRRATENGGGQIDYLPKRVYQSALSSLFDLEIATHEYAEALGTWERLQKAGADPTLESKVKPLFDHLATLRSDNEEYGVSGVMPDGSWSLRLFKRHFRIDVAEGYISQVKLRCGGGYVYFAFDPKLRYGVNSKYGDCTMELLGAPGARFTLYQF